MVQNPHGGLCFHSTNWMEWNDLINLNWVLVFVYSIDAN